LELEVFILQFSIFNSWRLVKMKNEELAAIFAFSGKTASTKNKNDSIP